MCAASLPSRHFAKGMLPANSPATCPSRVREFLRQIVPTHTDLTLEKGSSLVDQGLWQPAEKAFRQVLAELPANPAATLGLARCLIVQNQVDEGLNLLRSFPPSREFTAAETLRPLAEDMARPTTPDNADNPLLAAYERSLHLVRRGNLEAAMDGLLDILRQDKRFHDGAARKAMLAIFELLGEQNPLTRQYRAELASVLF